MSAPRSGISLRATITAVVETLLKTMHEVESQCNPSEFDYLDQNLKALETLQQFVASATVDLARRRNSLLPIHRLPTEIFLHVLQLVTGPNDDGWYHDILEPLRMAHVSSHWRSVILAVPSFWQVASDCINKRLQATTLRWNPDGPLVVSTRADDTEVADKFLARMLPLAHRWRTFILCRPYSDALPSYLQQLPPTLRDLTMEITEHHTVTCPLPLPDGHPLRHIYLGNVSVPWESSRLRNLQTLFLRDIYDYTPTIGQIVSILSSSPHLRQIVFDDWKESRFSTKHARRIDLRRHADVVIQLPSLVTLVLEELPTDITYFLISHIRATTLSCLITSISNDDDDEEKHTSVDITRPGSTFFDLVKQALSSPCIKTTGICYDTPLTEIESKPGPGRLRERYRSAEYPPGMRIELLTQRTTLQMLAEILATNAPCVSFTFSDDGEGPGQESEDTFVPRSIPLSLLPHLPNVESIVFSVPFSKVPVFRYLGTPRSGINGETTWLCPELSVVEILSPFRDDDAEDTAANVLDFIQRRYLKREAKDDDDQDNPRASEGENAGDELDSNSDRSSSIAGQYPVMLKRLILPEAVLRRFRELEDVQYLDRRGISISCQEDTVSID